MKIKSNILFCLLLYLTRILKTHYRYITIVKNQSIYICNFCCCLYSIFARHFIIVSSKNSLN